MANLIITGDCNRHCTYCFGRDDEGPLVHGSVSWPGFSAYLDYLGRSGFTEARLLGGEPTRHPLFARMVRACRARGLDLLVFTNGLMSDEPLDALVESGARIVLNVNPPGPGGPSTEHVRQREVVEALTDRVTLGITIERVPVDASVHLELLRRGAGPAVRVGLALPRAGARRPPIPLPRLARVGSELVRLGHELSEAGGQLHLDCGFCRCMLSEPAMAELGALGARLVFRCRPSIDVWPDLTVHPCYPLADWPSLGRITEPGVTHQDLVRRLQRLSRLYLPIGLFADCVGCALRARGTCDGGCLGWLRLRARPVTSALSTLAGRG